MRNPRAAEPAALAAIARRYGLQAEPCGTLVAGLAAARADAGESGEPVVICGSLFLVGEVLEVTMNA